MDLKDIKFYVDDRVADGVFRVRKEAFTDPVLFDLEQRYIFERVWNFLGLESQIPKPHDFFTAHIGRTPVIVSRDAQGAIAGLVNACRHKGAAVCRAEQGRAKYHVCPYHGWAYDSAGKNVDVKDRKTGGYAGAFDSQSHDLARIARIESYRGFLFGSLSADVPPLAQWLGDMAKV